MMDECETMKTEVAQLDSNVFKLEHKLKINRTTKELLSKMESKVCLFMNNFMINVFG